MARLGTLTPPAANTTSTHAAALRSGGRPTRRDLIQPGIEAVKKNWAVMLILQAVALLLVIGYYHVPIVTSICTRLSEIRTATGYLGAAVATAVAGVALPKLVRLLLRQPLAEPGQTLVGEAVFLSTLFGINGVMVDAFYRLLAVWFGDGTGLAQVLPKVAMDQLVFTPVLALPFIAGCFTLRDHGYRFGPALRELGVAWYFKRVVALMLPGWCYWTPMVMLIYSLPGPLQFVLFAFAIAAWSVVMVFIGESTRIRTGVALAE